MDKLGPMRIIRFIRKHKAPDGDYTTADKHTIDHMTVEEIYEEATRLESERKEK